MVTPPTSAHPAPPPPEKRLSVTLSLSHVTMDAVGGGGLGSGGLGGGGGGGSGAATPTTWQSRAVTEDTTALLGTAAGGRVPPGGAGGHGLPPGDAVDSLFAAVGSALPAVRGSSGVAEGGAGGAGGRDGRAGGGGGSTADNSAGLAEVRSLRTPAEIAAALLAPMTPTMAAATWMVHIKHPRRGSVAPGVAGATRIASLELCALASGDAVLVAERFIRTPSTVAATPVVEYVVCVAKTGTPLLQVRRLPSPTATAVVPSAGGLAPGLPLGMAHDYAVLALPPPRTVVAAALPPPAAHALVPGGSASHSASHSGSAGHSHTRASPAAGVPAGGSSSGGGGGDGHAYAHTGIDAGAGEDDGGHGHRHSKLTRGRRGRIVGLTVLTVARFLAFARSRRAARETTGERASPAPGGGSGSHGDGSTAPTAGDAVGDDAGHASGGGGGSGTKVALHPTRKSDDSTHSSGATSARTTRPSLIHPSGVPLAEAFELADPKVERPGLEGLPLPMPLRNQTGALRVSRVDTEASGTVVLDTEMEYLTLPAATVGAGRLAVSAAGALVAAVRGGARADAPLLSLQPVTAGDPDAFALRAALPLSLAQAAALAFALVDAALEPLH